MDMSVMITSFLVVLVAAILIIDTILDWRRPLQVSVSKGQTPRMVSASEQHSLDPKIGCNIVWC